ncbi:MAG: CoA pyrophosphatase [bacterium]|nr:MAG: CoA pyrophosphatase [bacterium]
MLTTIRKKLEEYQPEDLPVRANASVLVPLFEDSRGTGLVLIHRAKDSGPHSGQMGFPGGMVEVRDRGDLLATALRESREEIGVRPEDVQILGTLSQRRTVLTSLTVKPFVGVIPYPYQFRPDPAEVQSVSTAFLEDLAKGAMTHENPYDLPPPIYPVDGKPVWGLTAKMITELLEIIKL